MKASLLLLLITMSAVAFANKVDASDLFTYDREKLNSEMAELDNLASQITAGHFSIVQNMSTLSGNKPTSTLVKFGSSQFTIPAFMNSSYLSWAGILIHTGQSAESEMPRWLACILVGGVMFGIYMLVAALT